MRCTRAASRSAARAFRAGEELDAAALVRYLHAELGEVVALPLTVTQYPAGHSNLTYLVTSADGAEWVLRRPPFGNQVKSAHDMGREVRVQRALQEAFPLAPNPVLYEESGRVLGAPFYLMERARGTILRRKLPDGLRLEPATLQKLGDRFVDTLVALHDLPHEELGLGDFGRPVGYVERQVAGWSARYEKAKTDDVPEMIAVARWLAEHRPESPPPSILHNDYKLDNLVLDPDDLTRIVGVLDWEMSTVGDPLMDLGTALAYWIEPTDPAPLQGFTFGPTNAPGSPTRREIAARYALKRPSVSLEALRFYYVFALFKNAVVAQQIYARFVAGHTQDPRFGAMILGVRLLGATAQGVIDGADF